MKSKKETTKASKIKQDISRSLKGEKATALDERIETIMNKEKTHPKLGKASKYQKVVEKKVKKSKKKKLKFRFLRFILKLITFPFRHKVFLYLFLILLVGFLFLLNYLLEDLPSPTKLTATENFPVSTQLFDRHGTLLYEIYGDENRIPIKLDQVPKHLIEATIAIEDKKFYKHFGFDLEGIVRALLTNIKQEKVQGGSTITQQLIKNALLTREKSLKRKAKEAILAVMTEVIYSKDEIMEMYLNYISYGGTAVGIQSASKKYFNKDAKDLTLAESALLAGLPQAPSLYSPFGSSPKKAKDRQKEVLRRMREDGYITEKEETAASDEVLHFALSKTDIKAPHFVFYVRDWLYEKYGVETVEKGGLRVKTTLDLNLQEAAQATLSAEVEKLQSKKVGNGALMITKPNTGEILAMVGSKDYFNTAAEGQVNVALAQRQPGSSIKPIIYSIAFQEKTLNPGTLLLDIPTCFTSSYQKPYCPKNYTGGFSGPTTVRQALGNSLNIPAVKAVRITGVERIMNQAKKMGITGWNDPSLYGLSIGLGGAEVRMIDMTQAFGVLANQGVKVDLTPILEITDYQGKLIEKVDIEQRLADLNYLNTYISLEERDGVQRVMDQEPCYLVSHILQDNKARSAAFGSHSELIIKDKIVSVKTGTTNELKDNWTIGYTPEYLVIAWVGNNDNTAMSNLVSGVTGAAPIFNQVMTYVLEGKESIWQEKPADIKSGNLCASGMPVKETGEPCEIYSSDLYWELSLPARSRKSTKDIWIRTSTGLPPTSGEEASDLILQTKTIYQDPVTDLYCQECMRPIDENGKVVYEKYNVPEDYQIKALIDQAL